MPATLRSESFQDLGSRHRRERQRGILLAMLLGCLTALPGEAASPPQTVRSSPANEGDLISLPDGTLKCYYMERGDHVASIASRDEGQTWSQPRREFTVSGETGHAVRLLLDRQATLHLFFVQRREGGQGLPGGRYLDIWHSRQPSGQDWEPPQRIWEGYCGALRGAAQMAGGRLLLPFAAWRKDAGSAVAATGTNDTTVLYSDDGGASWTLSPARLTSPVMAGYNGSNYGAVEPTIVPLTDGRVWMLIRTQTGYLYESFSRDGIDWSIAAPSRFASSNSPATLLRLKDGRLLLIWNHCEMPPRVDGAGVYGGRDALHAAISSDEGENWRGFREIYRDPTRNQSPPKRGDRGTAYANAVETTSSKVLVVTGQGPARTMLLLHADWLEETRQSDDFSAGLDAWSVFKSFGPAKGWWRDRTTGPKLLPHPDEPGRNVLHIAGPAGEEPDGAVWNFPAGKSATVSLRLRLRPGFQGATIALVDRFFEPTDRRAIDQAVVSVSIKPDGTIGDGRKLSIDEWHEVQLDWHPVDGRCQLQVGGRPWQSLSTARPSPVGISYFWITSDAAATDEAGLLVERVAAETAP